MSGAADFLPAYYSLYCVRLDFIIIVAFIIPSLVQLRNLPSSPLSTPPFSLSPSPEILFPPLKCLLWPAARSWRRRILPRRRMLQPLQKKFIILSGSVVQHHALRLPLLTLWISVSSNSANKKIKKHVLELKLIPVYSEGNFCLLDFL